jgi:hypothetical protein
MDKGAIVWFKEGRAHECPYPGATIGVIESRRPEDVLLNMALSLHVAFVSAWMPLFRLRLYLPTAVLGVAKQPMSAGPKWPKQFGQADAGAVENGGALA